MYISGQNSIYGNPVNEKLFGIKKPEKPEKQKDISITEKLEKENQEQREDSLEISPEGRLAAVLEQELEEQEVSGEQEPSEASEKQSGKVAVNEGKRMRQIAAAKNQGQVQQVLSMLQKDLSDCKAGLEKGWCDEAEIAKVEALINRAKARMSQVPRNSAQEDEQGGMDEFAMASLM